MHFFLKITFLSFSYEDSRFIIVLIGNTGGFVNFLQLVFEPTCDELGLIRKLYNLSQIPVVLTPHHQHSSYECAVSSPK